jgi:DNA primase large subunit
MKNKQITVSRKEVNKRIGDYINRNRALKHKMAYFTELNEPKEDEIYAEAFKNTLGDVLEDLYTEHPDLRARVAQVKAEREQSTN